MKRPMSLAAKSEICSDARANNARVWGPEQEDWKQQWAIFDNIMVTPNPTGVLAERFRDLHQSVQSFAEVFGDFVKSFAEFNIRKSADENFGRLSGPVRKKMWECASANCAHFRDVAVGENERAYYDSLVKTLEINATTGVPWFKPWDVPDVISIDKDSRARGTGADRSALQGSWKFKGNVGKGGFGEVSCWDCTDAGTGIINRLIMKEAYVRSGWNTDTYWVGDANRRRPREYFYAKYLTSLPDSSCIVKPLAYAIYENIQMYRLYMEYCRHGDLGNMLREYTKGEVKDEGM